MGQPNSLISSESIISSSLSCLEQKDCQLSSQPKHPHTMAIHLELPMNLKTTWQCSGSSRAVLNSLYHKPWLTEVLTRQDGDWAKTTDCDYSKNGLPGYISKLSKLPEQVTRRKSLRTDPSVAVTFGPMKEGLLTVGWVGNTKNTAETAVR